MSETADPASMCMLAPPIHPSLADALPVSVLACSARVPLRVLLPLPDWLGAYLAVDHMFVWRPESSPGVQGAVLRHSQCGADSQQMRRVDRAQCAMRVYVQAR